MSEYVGSAVYAQVWFVYFSGGSGADGSINVRVGIQGSLAGAAGSLAAGVDFGGDNLINGVTEFAYGAAVPSFMPGVTFGALYNPFNDTTTMFVGGAVATDINEVGASVTYTGNIVAEMTLNPEGYFPAVNSMTPWENSSMDVTNPNLLPSNESSYFPGSGSGILPSQQEVIDDDFVGPLAPNRSYSNPRDLWDLPIGDTSRLNDQSANWGPIDPGFDPSSVKRPSVHQVSNSDFDALRGFPRGNNSNASRSDSNSSAGDMCDVGSSVSFDGVMQFMSGGVQDQSPSDRNQLVADDADKSGDGRISFSEAMGDGVGTGLMAPILLDLDGDGLEVSSLGTSASFFDMTGDRLQNKTAGARPAWGRLSF